MMTAHKINIDKHNQDIIDLQNYFFSLKKDASSSIDCSPKFKIKMLHELAMKKFFKTLYNTNLKSNLAKNDDVTSEEIIKRKKKKKKKAKVKITDKTRVYKKNHIRLPYIEKDFCYSSEGEFSSSLSDFKINKHEKGLIENNIRKKIDNISTKTKKSKNSRQKLGKGDFFLNWSIKLDIVEHIDDFEIDDSDDGTDSYGTLPNYKSLQRNEYICDVKNNQIIELVDESSMVFSKNKKNKALRNKKAKRKRRRKAKQLEELVTSDIESNSTILIDDKETIQTLENALIECNGTESICEEKIQINVKDKSDIPEKRKIDHEIPKFVYGNWAEESDITNNVCPLAQKQIFIEKEFGEKYDTVKICPSSEADIHSELSYVDTNLEINDRCNEKIVGFSNTFEEALKIKDYDNNDDNQWKEKIVTSLTNILIDKPINCTPSIKLNNVIKAKKKKAFSKSKKKSKLNQMSNPKQSDDPINTISAMDQENVDMPQTHVDLNPNFEHVQCDINSNIQLYMVGTLEKTTHTKKLFVSKCDNVRWKIKNPASKEIYTKQGTDHVLYLAKKLILPSDGEPFCTIVESLGPSKMFDSYKKALLTKYDLNRIHDDQIDTRFMENLNKISTKQAQKQRSLLLNLPIFTIDNQGETFLDHGFSYQSLKNGNYEIGFHVADVSFFIEPDSKFSKRLSKTGMEISLADSTHHLMSENICQLFSMDPGFETLAISIIWKVNKSGEILKYSIKKSIVNSLVKINYGDIEEKINKSNLTSFKSVNESIAALLHLAKSLRRRRFENGALEIDTPQTKFHSKLDVDYLLPHIEKKSDVQKLFEEFQILANKTVAEYMYKNSPKFCIMRVQPPPDKSRADDVVKHFNKIGFDIKDASAREFQRILSTTANEKARNIIASTYISNILPEPYYTCGFNSNGLSHFCINSNKYTHFTRPIKNNIDIITHRFLSQMLKNRKESSHITNEMMENLAKNCNEQEKRAKAAQNKSITLHFARYISIYSPLILDAVVSRIECFSLEIITTPYRYIKKIKYCDLNDVSIKYSETSSGNEIELYWHKSELYPETVQSLQVFSFIRVELTTDEVYEEIKIALKRPLVVMF